MRISDLIFFLSFFPSFSCKNSLIFFSCLSWFDFFFLLDDEKRRWVYHHDSILKNLVTYLKWQRKKTLVFFLLYPVLLVIIIINWYISLGMFVVFVQLIFRFFFQEPKWKKMFVICIDLFSTNHLQHLKEEKTLLEFLNFSFFPSDFDVHCGTEIFRITRNYWFQYNYLRHYLVYVYDYLVNVHWAKNWIIIMKRVHDDGDSRKSGKKFNNYYDDEKKIKNSLEYILHS